MPMISDGFSSFVPSFICSSRGGGRIGGGNFSSVAETCCCCRCPVRMNFMPPLSPRVCLCLYLSVCVYRVWSGVWLATGHRLLTTTAPEMLAVASQEAAAPAIATSTAASESRRMKPMRATESQGESKPRHRIPSKSSFDMWPLPMWSTHIVMMITYSRRTFSLQRPPAGSHFAQPLQQQRVRPTISQ